MRPSHIVLGAATILLAACGDTTEQRAASGGLGGVAAGALVGGPVGAVVGGAVGATGGTVLDKGLGEQVTEAVAGEGAESEATAGKAAGSEATAARAAGSGADVLAEIKRWDAFSTFSQALEATDLEQTLAGDGPFTVFAPTNDAFRELPKGAVDELMAQENRDELETLLRHHVVRGQRLGPTAIPKTLEPMGGGEISANMSGKELILGGGEGDGQGARVIGYAPADNGAVHVIDSVLLPQEVRNFLDEQQRSEQQRGGQPQRG
jgi:uncharacterized surface protein with fasciclin (FAS1) repeats